MAVFFILSMNDTPLGLEAKIDTICGENGKFSLKDGAWLVVFDGTAQLLSEKLGIRGGETEPALVLSVSNYSGRASPDIWDWLSTHLPVRAG